MAEMEDSKWLFVVVWKKGDEVRLRGIYNSEEEAQDWIDMVGKPFSGYFYIEEVEYHG